jgi:hypothetical protein
MPQVSSCNAATCSFNKDNKCHALAITVGDKHAARCDTFWHNGKHAGDVEEIAGVGACKMEDCEFNEGLYCTASIITVEQSPHGPICITYSPVTAPVTM